LYDLSRKKSKEQIVTDGRFYTFFPRPEIETVRAQVGRCLAGGGPLAGEFAKLPIEIGFDRVIVLLGLVGSALEIDGNQVPTRSPDEQHPTTEVLVFSELMIRIAAFFGQKNSHLHRRTHCTPT
jgi:hypothetical protein